MGCITSKAIGRSMSIREEVRSNRFRFQNNTSTSTWEELLNDHLFAFVRSNTTVTTSSFTLPNPETEYTSNACDLISDINGIAEAQSSLHGVEQPDFRRFTRSKSCQMLREKVNPENKLELNDNNLIGSRSFHTVEEYDALLERIHKSFENYYSCEDVKLQRSNHLDLNESCSSEINWDHFENVDMRETGWRRKAVAKGLKSLDVSSAVEFPAVARFKQRIHMEGQEQVYSPGTYITPKFGSYNGPGPAKQDNKFGGNSVFSPELVAAFEDCMQQLQLEEDNILRHMNVHSHGD